MSHKPFPGMDPYLEGYLWPDVHNALAAKIRQLISPQIQPNYVARLEISVVEDTAPDTGVSIIYPDVEVLQVKSTAEQPAPHGGVAVAEPPPLTAPMTLPLPRVKQIAVQIRDTAHNTLVTSIEILSPVNKRQPGLDKYLHKRARLRESGVNIVELDLLRRGQRVLNHPRLAEWPYLITLTRTEATVMELWPVALADPLPTIPIPLREPHTPVSLNLNTALNTVYEEAYYHLTIDYQAEPPPPALSETEAAWWSAQRETWFSSAETTDKV